ncbi:MAG: hypothetical protein HY748_16380 [Elusimicrobia bacterium]|nr:hypothetical protein [Elusimicrobiota bacterium]
MTALLLAAGLAMSPAEEAAPKPAPAEAATPKPALTDAGPEERRLAGSAETTAWCAWLAPATLDDVVKGVFAAYKVRPALMTGSAVSLSLKGRTHLAFEYLTQVLENEVRGKLDPANDNTILLDYAVRYRPLLLQRLRGSDYLFTRVDMGKFNGTAVLSPTTRAYEKRSEKVQTSFFLADLLWMREGRSEMTGVGLRLTEHKLPVIVYDVDGSGRSSYANPRLKDTRLRTVGAAVSVRDDGMAKSGSTPSRFERKPRFYLREVLLSLGYAEASNELIGNASGLSTTTDIDAGIRKDWRPSPASLLSVSLGVRSNLIYVHCISSLWRGGDHRGVESRTWLVGPYARLMFAF